MQLGTCPTVDSEAEDEAVKGQIGPGLLQQDQAKVASRKVTAGAWGAVPSHSRPLKRAQVLVPACLSLLGSGAYGLQ